ncbi:M23 family metallopeptidase [Pseudanabaena sp. UWO311]|uniref:M23 family metallopeptidase n=1 Tax=Pseudanabaena sp. UWO311 TaxID=2487337 RepID=UPI0011585553|nr:M23 family metallopeptidase [Pseudanabaena sp. UWO311]TYQ25538.1 M23 family metallopeptidase [Pseudanabaena sp. UWO311]
MKRSILVATLLHISLAPAYGQICKNGYSNQTLEEVAPVQRLGTARSERELKLHWLQPANYTEIFPFIGKSYQLSEHEGIDFINTNQSITQVSVRSVADGKVVYIRCGCPQSSPFGFNEKLHNCGGGWGNHIVLLHPNGLFTRYAHLYPDTIQVQVEQKVRRGEELAKMGNSGRSDTRHLHFELGVAIKFNSCEPAKSFVYVYNPAVVFLNGDR